ncbi:MAG TPA: pectinesterase family protein [Verrucomicrobiae bacterium]|nr:pectinesterase family protein [Verrucomicrobiae bacterium]
MKAFAILLCILPLEAAELVVAADGTAQFKTVQAAVDAAPAHTVIRIKPGTYKERVVVPATKPFLTFRGADAAATVITFDRHAGLPGADGKPINTFDTPTVFIQADDFTAEHIAFENSAGPHGQAVALTIMGDRGVFRDCRFLGYQDTLLAQAGRQYFERCYIEGAVDFIFGGSAAWFEECTIHATANGYLTAANTTKDQRYGYVFHRCKITGAPGVLTFLGRPWRPWAATVFLDTTMSEVVRPEGWNNWNDPAREKTVRYAENGSIGADTRVGWARRLSESDAKEYTIESVLGGLDGWNPKTGTVRSPIRITSGTAKPAKAHSWIAVAADGHLLSSKDGLNWSAARGSVPTRNARVAIAPDGVWHAVWSDGRFLLHASSPDGSRWSEPQSTDVMAGQNALDLDSPSVFYDASGGRFIVTWSCTLARNAIQAFQEEVEHNPRIWYAITRDFAAYSAPALLFDNNYAVRDAQILRDGSRYVLLHNDNSRPMRNLRAAFSEAPTGPWGPSTNAFTAMGSESPAAIRNEDEWWIYYGGKSPGLVRTRDFVHFTDSSAHLRFNDGSPPVSMLTLGR